MQFPNSDVPLAASTVHSELLLRMSREMDRFLVKLMQVEGNVSELIETHAGELPEHIAASIQNIDYVSQASVALSMLLTNISQNPDAGLDELLSDLQPTDLRDRLYNRLLEDIDNTENNIEIF